MRTLTLLTALVATTGVAHADDDDAPTWEARTWMSQRFLTSDSAATLTTDNLIGGGFAAERRITTIGLPGPFPTLDLAAELGFDASSASGVTFQQLDNDISTWQLTAGAHARVPLRSWLHLQGRASVGGGRTSVRIGDLAMTTAVADRGVTMVSEAALGVAVVPRLSAPGSRGFFLGFDLELGYHTATSIDVHAYPEDRPAPELTIPGRYASLGDLDLDGWTLRIGAVVGF